MNVDLQIAEIKEATIKIPVSERTPWLNPCNRRQRRRGWKRYKLLQKQTHYSWRVY